MNRTKLGGAALLLAGGFIGREGLIWAYGKLLDAVSAGFRSGMSFASLSWQNGVAAGLVGVGLVLLLWPRPAKSKVADFDKKESPAYLTMRGIGIINRVRWQRSRKWFQQDDLEPITDIVRDGFSILILYEKAGFSVPTFDTNSAERVAVGLEAYFSAMRPLLADGHIAEAKAVSVNASEQAKRVATLLNMQEWSEADF